MKLVGTIDQKGVWKCSPELASATTSISNQYYTTQTAPEIAQEINERVKRIEEELRIHGVSGTSKGDEKMRDSITYKGKAVTDISPGVHEANVQFMDNLLSIIRPRELQITHESMADGVTLELKCDEVHSQKLYSTYDVKLYSPVLTKTPKIAKPTPKKVIFSGPATTILWKDGTKTTVKCQDGDGWDDDVGIAMCYLKKMLGNKGNFNNIFREAAKVSDGCGWGFAKVNSSQVPESESYYSSALDSMKRNIDEINDFMKDAADALDKALGGKK